MTAIKGWTRGQCPRLTCANRVHNGVNLKAQESSIFIEHSKGPVRVFAREGWTCPPCPPLKPRRPKKRSAASKQLWTRRKDTMTDYAGENHEQRMLDWHGLRPSKAARCLRVVLGKRCVAFNGFDRHCLCRTVQQQPLFDHVRIWFDYVGPARACRRSPTTRASRACGCSARNSPPTESGSRSAIARRGTRIRPPCYSWSKTAT